MTAENVGNTLRTILVTRPLSDDQINLARSLELEPVVVPALRIGFPPADTSRLKKLEDRENTVWAFTSRNGVEGWIRVKEFVTLPAPQQVYAVGEKTAEFLNDSGVINVRVPERQDAVGLAGLIARDYEVDEAGSLQNDATRQEEGDNPEGKKEESARKPSVIHWCGNLSRPELKQHLEVSGIGYIGMEVYRTELETMELPDRKFDAILFYSPSAVEAFRQSGGFKKQLPPLFAIGETTGEALSLESGGDVHIPAVPSTEELLKLAARVLQSVPKQ